MSDTRPIGVLDSGLGGLTVVRELMRQMPDETIIYIGDTAHAPYGRRSNERIHDFGLKTVSLFSNIDLKLVIVACNTMSSVMLDCIEQKMQSIPVIGSVLPGVRASILRTAERKIGVIGTEAVIRSEAYIRAIHSIDIDIQVFAKACPLLVPLVEEGLIDFDVTRAAVQHYAYEMIDLGVDCLILGCTHYSLLIEQLQGTVGTRIQLLDSALWTAKEAQDILNVLDAFAPSGKNGFESSKLYITDLFPGYKEQARIFLGISDLEIQKVAVEKTC